MGYVQALQIGAIVGSATAGTNGNINSFHLPSAMTITFTGMRVTPHDGSPFHPLGVRPTVPVEPTLAGIRAGRDEGLDRALDILRASPRDGTGGASARPGVSSLAPQAVKPDAPLRPPRVELDRAAARPADAQAEMP